LIGCDGSALNEPRRCLRGPTWALRRVSSACRCAFSFVRRQSSSSDAFVLMVAVALDLRPLERPPPPARRQRKPLCLCGPHARSGFTIRSRDACLHERPPPRPRDMRTIAHTHTLALVHAIRLRARGRELARATGGELESDKGLRDVVQWADLWCERCGACVCGGVWMSWRVPAGNSIFVVDRCVLIVRVRH
jgi:hypothetical protein